MPSPTPAVPTSPFMSILAWSSDRPVWQKDALRRIVTSGELGANDLRDLAAICRVTHGLQAKTDTAPTVVPLADSHLPDGAGDPSSVSLIKLSGLQNVGRLPNDQEIAFGDTPGLTVIYGENGTGKSGYARVIKKACRARGKLQDIKPDAFGSPAVGPAQAKIVYRVGTTDISVDWTDGSPTDRLLGNVFVFDSFSAQFHVAEDGPACFKPRGLDVLPELAKACDKIGGELQEEIHAISAQITMTAQGWNYKPSTTVGKLLSTINANTLPESIDTASVFTGSDEDRLTEIIATLSNDPKKKSADTAAAANRIRTFSTNVKNLAVSVDDTAMQQIADALKEAETTSKAAKAAEGPEVKSGEFAWGDNNVWWELWRAAQKFSEQVAYKDKPFPYTAEDAKCVLCQQVLQHDGADRYARFNKFVADETRQRAEDAEARIAKLSTSVNASQTIGTGAGGIKADLDREASGVFAVTEEFAKAVDARITHAQKCLRDRTWNNVPVLPESPCESLIALANRLDERAREEESAADPKKKLELEKEKNELTDRRWLKSKTAGVKDQVARHADVEKLKKCLGDCNSRPVSDEAKRLDKQYITDAFCSAFATERNALGLRTLPVSLSPVRVAKGESQFGIVVDGAANANVEEIASEGEQRSIALAAFMAELSLASHKSALVFDDPVSSLDWRYRRAIAKRLLTEATIRQVVVFTHDLAFVCDLHAAAGSSKGALTELRIERLAGKPGRVMKGLVWDAMSVKAQFKSLRDDIGKLDKIAKESGDTEYREAAIPVIGRLRGACERVVEEILMNGTVKRHDSQLHIKNTPQIASVTDEQWKSVYAIHRECSNSDESHAKPVSGPVNIPTPEQLKNWMESLEKTVAEVKAARGSGSSSTITGTTPA